MLSDEDKVDLIKYISEIIGKSRSECSHQKLVALAHRGILGFIIDHPDVCAAEIGDFFCLEKKEFIKEFARLEKKGLI